MHKVNGHGVGAGVDQVGTELQVVEIAGVFVECVNDDAATIPLDLCIGIEVGRRLLPHRPADDLRPELGESRPRHPLLAPFRPITTGERHRFAQLVLPVSEHRILAVVGGPHNGHQHVGTLLRRREHHAA